MCKSCGSDNLSECNAEMNVHCLGYEELEKLSVWILPSLLVCLHCGFAELFSPTQLGFHDWEEAQRLRYEVFPSSPILVQQRLSVARRFS